MSNKKELGYLSVLQKFKTLIPNNTIKLAMCDFEQGLRNAVKETFGTTCHCSSCSVHYDRVIF